MIPDNSPLQPLRLPAVPPVALRVLIVALHIMAAASLMLTSLPLAGQALGVVALLLHGIGRARAFRSTHPCRVHEVLLGPASDTGEQQWWLRLGQATDSAVGQWYPAELRPDALIHPQVLLLRLRSQFGDHRVLLWADRDTAATLRRLRVRLRHPASGDQ